MIDLKKDRKDRYQPGSADWTEVDVPAMTYPAIDGHGIHLSDPRTVAPQKMRTMLHQPVRSGP